MNPSSRPIRRIRYAIVLLVLACLSASVCPVPLAVNAAESSLYDADKAFASYLFTEKYTIDSLAPGNQTDYILKNDGTVWKRQKDEDRSFSKLPLIGNIRSVAAGGYRSYAVDAEGTLFSWYESGPYYAKPVTGLPRVKQVASFYINTVAVTEAGDVYQWANDEDQQTPVKVEGLPKIAFIAAGYDFAAAVTVDGEVWMWGRNRNVGIDSETPVLQTGLTGIRKTVASQFSAAFIDADGNAWTMGSNDHGALGIDGQSASSPTRMAGLPPVADIKITQQYGIALDRDGDVWIWGDEPPKGDASRTPHKLDSAIRVSAIGVSDEGVLLLEAGRHDLYRLTSAGLEPAKVDPSLQRLDSKDILLKIGVSYGYVNGEKRFFAAPTEETAPYRDKQTIMVPLAFLPKLADRLKITSQSGKQATVTYNGLSTTFSSPDFKITGGVAYVSDQRLAQLLGRHRLETKGVLILSAEPALDAKKLEYYASKFVSLFWIYDRKTRKDGLITSEGKVILQPKYETAKSQSPEEDFIQVCVESDQCGFIDKNGTFVIEPHFQWAGDFFGGEYTLTQGPDNYIDKYGIPQSGGTNWYTGYGMDPLKLNLVHDNSVEKGILFGFEDYYGNTVIPFRFNFAGSFMSNGLAVAAVGGRSDNPLTIKGGKFGFINRTGEWVIPAIYDRAYSFWDWDNELALVNIGGKEGPHGFEGGKWGYINAQGKTIIPLQFEEAESFTNRLALVKLKGKWGAVNHAGTFIIPAKYDSITRLGSGSYQAASQGKYGLFDKQGRLLLPVKYKSVGDLTIPDRIPASLDGKKFGYINLKGKFVIPARFTGAGEYRNGLAIVSVACSSCTWYYGAQTLVDANGKQAIPGTYNSIQSYDENRVAFAEDLKGKMLIFNRSGKVLWKEK